MVGVIGEVCIVLFFYEQFVWYVVECFDVGFSDQDVFCDFQFLVVELQFWYEMECYVGFEYCLVVWMQVYCVFVLVGWIVCIDWIVVVVVFFDVCVVQYCEECVCDVFVYVVWFCGCEFGFDVFDYCVFVFDEVCGWFVEIDGV